ncbi:zinc-binding alcohol dehydrogenase family protein [Alteribacillus sp. HJP-4]|uniref:zinc-binding alcohol dehydrogenase family protein n=1 Tax=Alteribacillus sp. HJP-4 TaxID=2775394 RepID=UPI0035CD36A5
MKAVGFYRYLPISHQESLLDISVPDPEPKVRDLLVKIEAISVNPVDTKIRAPQGKVESEAQLIGWDACGVVEAVGEECEFFQPGDAVYYAGDVTRPGAYAEKQLVDERLAGRKPEQLSAAESAAMPLTTLTAWEALFERLSIEKEKEAGQSILIIGGAGGVGSIAIQLAKLAGLHVIATASRKETEVWCEKQGADVIINHKEALLPQLKEAGFGEVPYILCLADTAGHWDNLVQCIKPQGKICSIVETAKPLDLSMLQHKSASFLWEFMFTRSMYQTEDMAKQGEILNRAGELFDSGQLQATLNETLTPFGARTLREAHKKLETSEMIGKLVVKGF